MKQRKQKRRKKQKKPARRARRSPFAGHEPYEFLDHPADVGIRARGRTLEKLFANAAQALLDYGWELKSVRAREQVSVSATGHDRDSLLYNWLSEILFLCDAEQWVFREVKVARVTAQDTEYHADGTAHGERFDRSRHRSRTYIKAVTYHQLAVEKADRGWQATVYLDV